MATSALTFHSSGHGRMRRKQRNIRVRQLQSALKHGRRKRTGVRGRSKYTYKGITFVVDDKTKQEVTSYATPFDIPYYKVSSSQRMEHVQACQQIRRDAPHYCNSHSVILVDTSGSMRQSDVQGSRTRLAAVWYSIAQDFIKNRIDAGQAGSRDIISIILMGNHATFHHVVHNVPTDWVTYNAVLDIYKNGTVTPAGHGYYRPALSLAETTLELYSKSNCALLLAIMSDGRPSDASLDRTSYEACEASLVQSIAYLASRLGKRLTVSAVGMGSANRFDTLKSMTDKATEYESGGYFQLPSMSSSSIGAAISSIASSLTDSQSALFTLDGVAGARPNRYIREVVRESKRAMPVMTDVVNAQEFHIIMGDRVVHKVFDHNMEGAEPFRTVPLQHPDARGVAIAKKAFGEGTERFAFQFFEVAADGVSVVGEALVAKESKYVLETAGSAADETKKFVRRFCRIHHQASKVAMAFNTKMDSIRKLDSDTARVKFLPCSVYYLKDPAKGDTIVGVEHRLFGNFQKWNSNNGWKKSRKNRMSSSCNEQPLPPITEETTSMAMEEEDDRGTSATINIDMNDVDESLFVTQDEVAQAFSHYSYIFGGRRSLICDLQGVYNRKERQLKFTDPVIHYHDVFKEDKRGQYGRTDRGEKGIDYFLHSHECNALCDIVTKGFFPVQSN